MKSRLAGAQGARMSAVIVTMGVWGFIRPDADNDTAAWWCGSWLALCTRARELFADSLEAPAGLRGGRMRKG